MVLVKAFKRVVFERYADAIDARGERSTARHPTDCRPKSTQVRTRSTRGFVYGAADGGVKSVASNRSGVRFMGPPAGCLRRPTHRWTPPSGLRANW